MGNTTNHAYEHADIDSFDIVPQKKRETVKKLAEAAIKDRSYLPVALAIQNSSPSGIRNLFVEMNILSSSRTVEITENASTRGSTFFRWRGVQLWRRSEISERVEQKLSKFDEGKLQRSDNGWRLSFEWEALQPQRTRLIKPVLYVYSRETAKVSIESRVFADSFPEPLFLRASLTIEVTHALAELPNILPDWKKLIKENGQERESNTDRPD